MKLTKLPDKKPVKLSLTITAELQQKLKLYARVYHSTYGEEVSVPELAPFMLEGFLKSDPSFTKAQRKGA